MKKIGIFLARMQPMHNAHKWLIDNALSECDEVLIVLVSENKVDMLRNPYDIALRKEILSELYTGDDYKRLKLITLPDWSMESCTEDSQIWGRYLYYNIVSYIGQKQITIYYSDKLEIINSWFCGTEIEKYINIRHFERESLFEGLSATKIREAFINDDFNYICRFCPKPVIDRYEYLKKYYKNVSNNPKDDYSME